MDQIEIISDSIDDEERNQRNSENQITNGTGKLPSL